MTSPLIKLMIKLMQNPFHFFIHYCSPIFLAFAVTVIVSLKYLSSFAISLPVAIDVIVLIAEDL